MREILFRGKRKDNGEWIESRSILQFVYGAVYLNYRGTWVMVIPETVGQYVGFDDKNGKKIFDGDILKTAEFIGKVVYNKIIAAFIVEINDSTESYYHWSPLNEGDIEREERLQYTEVIGNVHDGG